MAQAPATPTGGKVTSLSGRLSGAWNALMGKASEPAPSPAIGPDPVAAQTPEGAPFGPMQPLSPFFQKEMAGRQFDYVTGLNLTYQPRPYEPVTFEQLRSLADNLDILRLVIETRKDQLCKIEWTVRPKDKTADQDATCQEIEKFLAYPDGEHDWPTWLRMVLEDLFVIDAPTIYPVVNKGGKLLSLDIMDGALISRKIDASGRTPKPPGTAYQQIIKGVPAVDYCMLDIAGRAKPGSELIYVPRNPRSWKLYGYSPVEQIIITVNIAIRRQLYTLQYYTDGSMPDSLIQCPPEWTAEQISQMQDYFDGLLSGNTAERRRARFVPGGTGAKVIDTKDKALKDEMDEWLARVVCFCFSLPPTAFIKSNNRATAENVKEQAEEEGTTVLLAWVRSLMNMIIARYWSPNYQLIPADEVDTDPQVQAEIDKIYLQEYVIAPNEVRTRLGLKGDAPEKPLPPALGQPIAEDGSLPDDTPTPPPPPDDAQKFDAPDVLRKEQAIEPIDRNRPEVAEARKEFTEVMSAFLADQSKDLALQVSRLYMKYKDSLDVGRIIDELDFSGWSVAIDKAQPFLQRVFEEGGAAAFHQIDFAPEESMTNLVSQQAVDYAATRAADLVGMKNIGTAQDPQWIENPDAKWAITDTTRERLRAAVKDAVENGTSPQDLRQSIIDSEAFSPDRARMVARTELAFADSRGNMAAYRESGVVHGKQWILGSEHDDDDECNDNAGAGVIGLDDSFPSGAVEAPAHPNCVCDVIPVVIERGE